ncbi:2-hydroxyacid dehydrogenase [Halomonas sp. SpR1]|uniref:2-hydroxyacid dehydrogenase n=1 Tax=Halomonas sp. SpR1 TaxID=3050462 RepID=UPI0027E4D6B7|nr:2-hydroxyacid dehydrogenase [Halomonas sp. SpR1]MDQ7734706.1 2-hydroxyacid dehydrogenase [Halomonas sp. SpR1]
MKHTLLQMCPLSPTLDRQLTELFTVHKWSDVTDQEVFFKEHGNAIVGVATAAPTGVPNDIINHLPNLKVISCRGVGMDKIDLNLAKQKKIQVSGTFGALNECVADMAFALLLDTVREVSTADRYVRNGEWLKGRYPLTTRVSGKRLGVVGMGEIGSLVAKRAQGFDMDIAYHNRKPVEGSPHLFKENLEELAEWCDFLVITVAGNAHTKNLISRSVLQALGKEGFLINVSRGFVVDEDALIKALSQGQIKGAGLDVFVEEPKVPSSLLAMDNVVLAPHMASGTIETRKDMEELVLENLKYFFESGQVKTPAF